MVSFFHLTFPTLIHKENYLNMIIENNFPKKFLKNHFKNLCIEQKKTYYKKLIINNMKNNFNYVNLDLKTIINFQNYKTFNNKKIEEFYFNLMEEIVWCNYNNNSLIYLFTGYNILINEQENLYETLYNHLIILLKNYQKKIWYIKKLKILN